MGSLARLPLMVANWKMHGTYFAAMQWVQALGYQLDAGDYARVEVGVAPAFTSLRSVQTVIQMDDLPIRLVAQNVHWAAEGAFTGEVSASMLAKLSVSYVIVGHSERRIHFGEDDRMVSRKARATLDAGMMPIVAVGETLEERERGLAQETVSRQLSASLSGVSTERLAQTVIAYEPVWAIGTGRHADPSIAQEMTSHIRERLALKHGEEATRVRIIYGGSINPGNVAAFMAQTDIDGALIGGASLDPRTLAACVTYWK